MKFNKKIILLVAFVAVLIVAAVWYATSDDRRAEEKSSSLVSSEVSFKSEYPNVAEDNRYVYATSEEIIEIFNSGDGLVFLGFPECPWCQQLAPIVDEAAKAEDLEKIYYLNIREARGANSDSYQALIEKLGEHLEKDDDGNPRIYVPDVTAVSRGEIVGRFIQEATEDSEQVTPDTYWTSERRERAIEQLRGMISGVKPFSAVQRDIDAGGATLLDVRTQEEYKSGHFAEATNFDVNNILAGKYPDVDKGSKVYVYCRSGNRSAQATELLKRAGFSDVVDLGGLSDVQRMGAKLVTN